MRRCLPFVFGVFLLPGNVFGQAIVSARSGSIHRVEGRAFIDGEAVETKFAVFPSLRPGSVLRTELGRVEVLLTPGAILRMGEHSSVRMISSELSDTRLQLLEGSALVEVMELLEDNAITLYHNGASLQPFRGGLYRIDTDPPRFRVYDGRAVVVKGDERITAKKGRQVALGESLLSAKFDPKVGDPLYRWSSRRSSYLAAANIPAARSLQQMGMSWRTGGWQWNPYFGMFTYIPARALLSSPFGWSYWSPRNVSLVYQHPSAVVNAGGGAVTGGGGGSAVVSRPPGSVSSSVPMRAPAAGSVGDRSGGASRTAPIERPAGGSAPSGAVRGRTP